VISALRELPQRQERRELETHLHGRSYSSRSTYEIRPYVLRSRHGAARSTDTTKPSEPGRVRAEAFLAPPRACADDTADAREYTGAQGRYQSPQGCSGREEPQGGGLDRMRVRMGSTRDCAAENLTRVSFFENTVCDRSVELRDMPPTERRNEWLLLPRKG